MAVEEGCTPFHEVTTPNQVTGWWTSYSYVAIQAHVDRPNLYVTHNVQSVGKAGYL